MSQSRTPFLAFALALLAMASGSSPAQSPPAFTAAEAKRFVDLALHCVHREYPNKIAHVMNDDGDALPPRELTPVFYGCFDWHSAVHGHWLLVRAARTWPDASFASAARQALAKNFTAEGVAREVSYISDEQRTSFERPYGLAWLLQLCAELREWNDPQAKEWSRILAPLEALAADRFRTWLPKLTHPIRTGEHSQTAFALGLVLDWAKIAGDEAMTTLVRQRALDFHLADRGASLAFEPGGQDFLSPALAEADLMRRVLSAEAFAAWLGAFLPEVPIDGQAGWLEPGLVTDKSDGKLAHLDGLNLARAWMLEGIVQALPEADPRRAALAASAKRHRTVGLAAVTGEDYAGGHWLGSFALYLVTGRGLR